MNKNKNGFTLLELLAVIVILSILVVLAVPKVTDILRTSKQKTYETNKEVIEKAAKGYILDHPEETEVSLQTLLDDNLLDTIPIDPRTNEEMDGYLVLYDGKGDYKTGDFSEGYNSPELSKNMYPVKWNGTAWQVTNKDDVEWYLYHADNEIDNSGDTNKDDGQGAFTADKWANAHITTEVLSEGDTIEEIELNLYVWIPRYTYLLDEPSKTIQVKYTQGINDDNSSNYLSHPGFTFGDQEVTGIWVAKFEMSYDKDKTDSQGGTYTTGNDYIFMSRPNSGTEPARGSDIVELKEKNIISRNINVNDIFEESRELEEEYLINADTHMIKSSEWGAVAYLTEAIRDGEEVWINNQGTYDEVAKDADNDNYYYYYRDYITGCSEGPAKNSGANEDAICSNPYNSIQGQKGSTTGNEYGIYDMSGGLWEYNATYLNDNPNTTIYDSRYTSTSYMKSLANAENKYKDILETDVNNPYADSYENSRDNYLYFINTNGLVLHEISTEGTGATSWYGDYSYYPNEYLPTVRRGGLFNIGSSAGLFAFSRHSGIANIHLGWRVVWLL